jgi:hypothetical protein
MKRGHLLLARITCVRQAFCIRSPRVPRGSPCKNCRLDLKTPSEIMSVQRESWRNFMLDFLYTKLPSEREITVT